MDSPVMKALIVDDEPVARRVLREELELFPGVQVIGEAENGKEALQQITRLQPDVVFLDLQMPAMSGFEVVRNLNGPALPVVVMVTAFDRHAMEAFEAGAIDYLLKPVSETRLRTSVERARRMLGRPEEIASRVEKIAAAEPEIVPRSRKVVGRSGEAYILLDLKEVLVFQAEGELVWIITPKQRLLATQTLRAIEERLMGEPFFYRVHRNAIVNVDHIRKMSSLSSQRWLITLSNALQVVVSKRQARRIRDILQW
jgi:DNA-binding LytR/AlgR family response regulator